MASLAVLASGYGSNFEAIALALNGGPHDLVLLVCDRPGAYAVERARRLKVPSRLVSYKGRKREAVEEEIGLYLDETGVDAIALAGYMRILGPMIVGRYRGRLLNVHPSLLPAYPGVDAIRRMYEAGENRFGVTVHLVDEGVDSGGILAQEATERIEGESLADLEERIHAIEHRLFPRVIVDILDSLDQRSGQARPAKEGKP